jgi:uncharacterized membrane protein required for colicin V production
MYGGLQMNVADWVVLGILIFHGIAAYHRGFVLSLFKLVSFAVSIFLTYKLYPTVSTFLRQSTRLYQGLKHSIAASLAIQGDQIHTLHGQTELIQNLKLPGILKDALIENNNPEVYQILNVEGLKEYVSGYIANISINILAMILVLFLVTIGLKIVVSFLDLIAKLPVLHTVNKLTGLIFGLVCGTLQIWILYIICMFFYTNPHLQIVFGWIENGNVSKYLYENNLLLFLVTKLFL